RVAAVLDRVRHLGHVPEPHRSSIDVADDERPVGGGGHSWSVARSSQAAEASDSCPLGRSALAFESAARTWSRPMPNLLSTVGFASTRTAGRALPPTLTCPTPSTWASFCARIESAAS